MLSMRRLISEQLWVIVLALTLLKRKIADVAFLLNPSRRTL
jgi:hypothetical protein